MTTKPKLILMVGPPAVGKDYYIQHNLKEFIRVNQDDRDQVVKKLHSRGITVLQCAEGEF